MQTEAVCCGLLTQSGIVHPGLTKRFRKSELCGFAKKGVPAHAGTPKSKSTDSIAGDLASRSDRAIFGKVSPG